jgi:hypothetical protein
MRAVLPKVEEGDLFRVRCFCSVPLVVARWASRLATPRDALVSAFFLDEPWVLFVESPVAVLSFTNHKSEGRGGIDAVWCSMYRSLWPGRLVELATPLMDPLAVFACGVGCGNCDSPGVATAHRPLTC